MPIEAVIPAFNEALTIANVVQAIRDSGVITHVIVVDDGSKDDTAKEAEHAGAVVIRTPNGGKGRAMRVGFNATTAPFVAFFDADLLNLRPANVLALAEPILSGKALMSCGLRDYGAVYNAIQPSLPLITGERIVARQILNAVPQEFWSGWRFEAAVNETARRMQAPVATTVLTGVTMRPKWAKVGVKKGLEDGVKMMVDVLIAIRDAQSRP